MIIDLPRPLVCLVTDRRATADPLPEVVRRAVEGGVNLVQVREKDLPAGALLALVRAVLAAVDGRVPVVVNDRLDVALAAGASGAHLPGDSLPVAAARSLLGDRLLGCSVHSATEAANAAAQGADYVVLGTVFPTLSKPGHPGAGLAFVEAAARQCPRPLVAIGGITAANAGSVVAAGATGVAVISAILRAPDPRAAAAELRAAVEQAWRGAGTARAG